MNLDGNSAVMQAGGIQLGGDQFTIPDRLGESIDAPTDLKGDDVLIAHDLRMDDVLVIHQEDSLTASQRAAIAQVLGRDFAGGLPEELWTFDTISEFLQDRDTSDSRVVNGLGGTELRLIFIPGQAPLRSVAYVRSPDTDELYNMAYGLSVPLSDLYDNAAVEEVTHKISHTVFGSDLTPGQHELLGSLTAAQFNPYVEARRIIAAMATANSPPSYDLKERAAYTAVMQTLDNLGWERPNLSEAEFVAEMVATNYAGDASLRHVLYSHGVVPPKPVDQFEESSLPFGDFMDEFARVLIGEYSRNLPAYIVPNSGVHDPRRSSVELDDLVALRPESDVSGELEMALPQVKSSGDATNDVESGEDLLALLRAAQVDAPSLPSKTLDSKALFSDLPKPESFDVPDIGNFLPDTFEVPNNDTQEVRDQLNALGLDL